MGVSRLAKSAGFVASILLPFQAFADHRVIPGELVILKNTGIQANVESSALSSLGLIAVKSSSDRVGRLVIANHPLASLSSERAKAVSVDERELKSLKATCEKVVASGIATHCDPNYVYKSYGVPNDPSFGELWGMTKIRAPQAWDLTTGSANVVVAVIDTGVDYNHPDLGTNVWVNPLEVADDGIDNDGNGFVDDIHGYDFSDDDSDPMDLNGHGSHVSGTIGGVGNDGVGVVGVNHTVRIQAVRVLDADGSGTLEGVVSGILYAARNGASVINMSLGSDEGASTEEAAIREAGVHGILVAAAAGNDGLDNDTEGSFPANYHLGNIISVAATDVNDNMADFSNFGAHSVHVAAPGVDILSTTPGNTYDVYSGTSMATPHVAGLAALLKSVNSQFGENDLKSLILETVSPLDSLSGLTTTGGQIDAFSAVQAASVRTPTPRSGSGDVTRMRLKSTKKGGNKFQLTVTATGYAVGAVNLSNLAGVSVTISCRDPKSRKSYRKAGSTGVRGTFAPTLKFSEKKMNCTATGPNNVRSSTVKVK